MSDPGGVSSVPDLRSQELTSKSFEEIAESIDANARRSPLEPSQHLVEARVGAELQLENAKSARLQANLRYSEFEKTTPEVKLFFGDRARRAWYQQLETYNSARAAAEKAVPAAERELYYASDLCSLDVVQRWTERILDGWKSAAAQIEREITLLS